MPPIDQARPRQEHSQTVHCACGGSEINAARTSDGRFSARGETTLVARIEQRIAALLNWPADRGEGLQVLRYRPGALYRPHHDYFDPAQAGSAAVLARGGATVFPDIGLEIAPVKGRAVFFSHDRPHDSTATLHGGAEVSQGEKRVATKWLREGVFD